MKTFVHSNARVFQPHGRLDAESGTELRQEIEKFCRNNETLILLDMSEISFTNSAGLGLLVAIFKDIKKIGGKIVLANLHPTVSDLFEVTQLNKIFAVYPNIHEAVQALKS